MVVEHALVHCSASKLTGYEQVRSIIAEIAGDKGAAVRVELVLPKTGVCSRPPVGEVEGCCGAAAAADTSSCCATDEFAKFEGKSE